MGLLRFIIRALTGAERRRQDQAAQEDATWDPFAPLVPRVPTAPTVEVTTYTRVVTSINLPPPAAPLRGRAWVIDGDTIVIGGTKIRLAGIDAPELDHPFGKQAKFAMVALCKGQVVTAHFDGNSSHDRCVATCYLPDGRDLSAELVKIGLAIDWAKHSGGKYRPLEIPEVRRKLWRAHNRQTGRFNY